MTEQEAKGWLSRVEGTAFQNKRAPAGPKSWVAVVRTPAPTGRRGKIILAFGKNLSEAARAAEQEWHKQWQSFGALH